MRSYRIEEKAEMIAEKMTSLRLRIRLLTKKRDCKHCCLRCEYYELCACEYLTTEVEYKGYTAVQSGLNNHVSIYNSDGKHVYHAQQRKQLSKRGLQDTVDFYLNLINGEFKKTK